MEKPLSDIDDTRWRQAFDAGDAPIEVVRQLTGGTQNELLLLRIGDTEAVLRRGPADKADANAKVLGREARTLAALAASGVPHPRLLSSCADGSAIGQPYILMEYREGFNATAEVPDAVVDDPSTHGAPARELVRALGKLADFDYRTTELGTTARPDGWLERQVDRWSGQVDEYAQSAEWKDTAHRASTISAWLSESYPDNRRAGITHGDFHIGNFLFDRDDATLTAIVDWELATIGDPRLDFGHLLATWPKPTDPRRSGLAVDLAGLPDRSGLIELHTEVNPHLADDLPWFYVLACFRLATILEGSWFRARAGRIPAPIGDRLHGIAASLYENAHTTIETGDPS